MRPLREVEKLAPQDFSRSSEKRSAPPQHWTIPSYEASSAYMDYLDSLTLPERELVVTELLHTRIGAGYLVQRRGYSDIVEKRFGICGNSEPWIVYHSEIMEAELDSHAEAWRSLALKRGVAKDNEKKVGFWNDLRMIKLGFQRLVAEVIYGDYGDNWLTEDAAPHMEEIMMDSLRLRSLAAEWYKDNAPEPIKRGLPLLRGMLE